MKSTTQCGANLMTLTGLRCYVKHADTIGGRSLLSRFLGKSICNGKQMDRCRIRHRLYLMMVEILPVRLTFT